MGIGRFVLGDAPQSRPQPALRWMASSCPRLFQDLSNGLHGSEGGADGWGHDEAAAISMLLDYLGFSYDFYLNDIQMRPPLYRLVLSSHLSLGHLEFWLSLNMLTAFPT